MSEIDIPSVLKANSVLVEKELNRLLPHDQSILSKAMRYSMFAGGKHFRATLVLESARLCGGKVPETIAAACAVEMLHTFTLIHDDLPAMDDSDLRRGKPILSRSKWWRRTLSSRKCRRSRRNWEKR